MAPDQDRKLSDDELDELARKLFNEVRAEHQDKPEAERREDGLGDAAGDIVDWLLDMADGDD